MRSYKFWLIPITSVVALAVTGCFGKSMSFSYYEPDHVRVKRVYLPSHHVCSHRCHEHYWDGRGVVVLRGHRHGPGCGHHWDGGYWKGIRKGNVKKIHPRHRRGVVKKGHVHGPGCGHHWDGRYWKKAHKGKVKKDHTRRGRGVIKKGHVHGAGCGHHWDGRKWKSVRKDKAKKIRRRGD